MLLRYIERRGPNGEEVQGVFISILTKSIGRGAYDQEGHRNARFLHATDPGPYPRKVQYAWRHTFPYGWGDAGGDDLDKV